MCPAAARSVRIDRSPVVGALARFRAEIPFTVRVADAWRDGVFPVACGDAHRHREIAPDPDGWLTAIRLDVDLANARDSWRAIGFPQPNLIIERASNGHAHLIWFLSEWVRCDRRRADDWARAVRAAMTAALGADTSYSGTFVHNPLSAAYTTIEGPATGYTLGELAEVPAIAAALAAIAMQRRRHRDRSQLRLVPAAGAVDVDPTHRNCTLFERVRKWAYRAVAGFASEDALRGAVLEQLVAANPNVAAAAGKAPLKACELAATAKSISRWTWANRAMLGVARGEKARKRAENCRRSAGAMARSSYRARASDRALRAVSASKAGLAVAEIAKALGVAARTVQRYLAETTPAARPAATSPCAISESLPVAEVGAAKKKAISLLEYARSVIGALPNPRMEPCNLRLQLWSNAIVGEPSGYERRSDRLISRIYSCSDLRAAQGFGHD